MDSRGSITVLVVLILIPTIVFEGFLVDLARLKLYGNQAVMTADNYGEAVLSVYNNVLKDLYGLYAISEDKGKDALSSLKEYMPSSFNPNESAISWDHVQGVQKMAGTLTTYSGFMPYSGAEIALSYTPVESSRLSDMDVIATQLGDFMKFRVIQTLTDDGTELLDAWDAVTNSKSDSNVVDMKEQFDESVKAILETCKDFYTNVKILNSYNRDHVSEKGGNGYIRNVITRAKEAHDELETIYKSESFALYMAYKQEKDSIDAAVAARNNLKEGETLSEYDQKLVEIYDRYIADPNAREDALRQKMEDVAYEYESFLNGWGDTVCFYNYDDFTKMARNCVDTLETQYVTLQACIEKMEEALDDPDITPSMKDGIQKNVDAIKNLFKTGDEYSVDHYDFLVRVLESQMPFNNEACKNAENHLDTMKVQISNYLNGQTAVYDGDYFDPNQYDDFYENYIQCKKLYDNLDALFGEAGTNEDGETRSEEVDGVAEDAGDQFKNDETSSARDIPESINIGTNSGGVSLEDTSFYRLIDTAVSIFDADNLSDGFNETLTKVYTVLYDLDMFSSRVTNIDPETGKTSEESAAESLTGYLLCKDINYLYGAEIEYLFGGYKSSDDNLTETRNKIIAFRAITNFASSYSISEINTAITTAANAVMLVNVFAGIALEASLRIAFAMLETASDWDLLMGGKGIILLKTSLDDISAYDQLKKILPELKETPGESSAFRMDYETYLTIMLLAMTTDEQIFERTGDLISLNVSTVEQNIGADGTLSSLSLDMDKAYTAVDASCSVKLDFAVLPEGMANVLLGGNTSTLEKIKNKGYKFTVTRGY